jgi:stage II sporulation protein M
MFQKLKGIFNDFYNLRHYIVVSVLIFITGMYLGYNSTIFHNYLEGQIEGLAEIAGGLFEMENAELWVFLFIFLNNTVKSILVIYLGFFFGVLPIVFLLINGMVLGYLYLYVVVLHESTTVGALIMGILPHGIIELPVVIIACAYGIRMGALVWKKILGWMSPKSQRKGELTEFIIKTPPLLLFITITLLIAALIETFITPWIMAL